MVGGVPVDDEDRYETLLRAVPDTVYTMDLDGRLTSINTTGKTGYTRTELLGEHASTIMTDASVERGREVVGALLADDDRDQATFEMELVTKDGERLPHENHLALLPPDEDGSVPGTIGVLRDIAEQRAREAELEMYERIVEASGDGMYALDREGRYTFVNQAAAELRGHGEAELLGEPASSVTHEAFVERAEALIRELLESGRRHGTIETPLTAKGGERIHVENQIALLTDEDGTFQGTVGVVRDITEREERERELRRQNDRLDQFASVLSHDLRNPLNLAQGRLEQAREEHDGEHLAEIDWALGRMDQLVDDVLTLARQGQTPEDTEPVPLAAAAEDAWATVGEAGDLVVASDGIVVDADASRLRRLLGNLFRNAVEHAGPDPRVAVGPTEGGFYVADDGPGVPEGERDRVFEQGFTTADDGTGFGLAIVREIAEAHGWTATVTESESGGARFDVTGVEFVAE